MGYEEQDRLTQKDLESVRRMAGHKHYGDLRRVLASWEKRGELLERSESILRGAGYGTSPGIVSEIKDALRDGTS